MLNLSRHRDCGRESPKGQLFSGESIEAVQTLLHAMPASDLSWRLRA